LNIRDRKKTNIKMSLAGRVAIITGSSRGIGRALALALGAEGCSVVVTAKTVVEDPANFMEGSIHTVAAEVEATGGKALPFQCDVSDADMVEDMVATAARELGPPSILINNASALWWKSIEETPAKRYDLINSINARGTFLTTRACLPFMRENNWGHVVTQSPPIVLDKMAGMTAYNISKFGMTLTALGVAAEYASSGVAGNSIWPTTLIESAATRNHGLGEPKHWRKADILVDAIMGIVQEDPHTFSGNMLLDEPYLRSKGVTEFERYACVPGSVVPNINDVAALVSGAGSDSIVKKGAR
jgi:citronellol/citronellal dehydrogenase